MPANGWRIMWVIAIYDCPMTSKGERRDYTIFRKRLLRSCYFQLQNSLYVKHFPTKALAEGSIHRLKNFIPKGAKVSFFLVTDKQYSMTTEFFGPEPKKQRPDAPEQITLF